MSTIALYFYLTDLSHAHHLNSQGFMLVSLTHEVHHIEFVYVSTIKSTNYTTSCDYAVDTMAGEPGSWEESECSGM